MSLTLPRCKEGVQIRRANFEDIRGFNALLNTSGGAPLYKATFGQFNYSTMIEYSFLSLIIAADGDDTSCLGFVSINDSASLGGDIEFETVINFIPRIIPVSLKVSNTLFINFWMLDDRQKQCNDLGHDLMRKLFELCPHIDHIIWLCPPLVRISEFMEKVFSQTQIKDEDCQGPVSSLKGHRILHANRNHFLPKLLVREARVEDCDDLLPILRNNNANVVNGQEDFFLADLIQQQDARNRFFVGLSENEIVGMLATSLDVNVSLITKIFDIDPFTGIIIQKDDMAKPNPILVSIVGDIRLIDSKSLAEITKGLGCLLVDAEEDFGVILSDLDAEMEESNNEDKLRNEQGTKDLAKKHIETLQDYIQKITNSAHNDDQYPLVCIVYGFPRTEEEAHALAQSSLTFDVIIELQNVAEDGDVDEEDDFLHMHLDAVEIVRSSTFEADKNMYPGHADEFSIHHKETQWRKLLIDTGIQSTSETIRSIGDELRIVHNGRKQEIEMLELEYEQEPPQANAFAVTVFCIEPVFQSRAEDMLRVAFEDHPDLSYCLFMVPCNAPPSLLTNPLVAAKVRPGVSFDQCLYVMQREVFMAQEHLVVSRMMEISTSSVEEFLMPLDTEERFSIMKSNKNSIRESDVELKDNPSDVTFIARMGTEIVSVLVLSRKCTTNEDVNWLRANFNLDDHLNFERHRGRAQASIVHWILSPSFRSWSRYILREVLRMYGKTVLYYQAARHVVPPVDVLDEMIAARPRRRAQKAPNGRDAPLLIRSLAGTTAATVSPGIDCPVYFIAKRHISQRRDNVATRVVIVGGSSSSFALLETICFSPHVNFMNVSLILDVLPKSLQQPILPDVPQADNGGSDEENVRKNTPEQFGFCGCLSVCDADDPLEHELFAMGLTHKITVIKGRLTDIDRPNRAVVVSDDAVVEYDLLVISTATQDSTVKKFPAVAGVHPATCAERGIFGLGSIHSDAQAASWVRKRDGPRTGAVVVYGRDIAAFTAVGKLIKGGTDPNRIVLILTDDGNLPEYGNNAVNDAILSGFEMSGVQYLKRHVIVDVALSSQHYIQSITVEDLDFVEPEKPLHHSSHQDKNKPTRIKELPCFSLLCCNSLQCDVDVFAAINDSGLVYDGGVVVDQNFRTVDPYVYAVGSFTRYSRIYRDAVPHSRYNGRELGVYVGTRLLESHLDPTSRVVDFTRPDSNTSKPNSAKTRAGLNSASSSTVMMNNNNSTRTLGGAGAVMPVFQYPKTVYTDLPGGIRLLYSALPVQPVDTTPLVTTGGHGNEKISVLKVDLLGGIVEFAFIGTAVIEERNLSKIVGWHEAYLNSAVYSFEHGLVTDWIDYLREEWATALYYDKFPDLAKAIKHSLRTDKGMFSISDRVFDTADSTTDDGIVAAGRRRLVGDHGELLPDTTAKSIESHTLDFLRKNKDILNRFHIPQPGGK